jgi:ATP-dependent helicase/nuclease subunit A
MSAAADDVLARLFAFERNTVVRASAGTGKTEALAGLYVHLVLGATERAVGLSPTGIIAITFTEKATEEMRARISTALGAVALGPWTPDDIPEDRAFPLAARKVLESLRTRGRFEGREAEIRTRARAALEALPSAPIQTIHGFAARLVRAHAVERGLPPRFDVLAEAAAGEWLEEALAVTMEARLRAGDAALGAFVEETRAFFGSSGVAAALGKVIGAIRESGREPGPWLTEPGYSVPVAEMLARTLASLGASGDDLGPAWGKVAKAHRRLIQLDSARQKATRQRAEDACAQFEAGSAGRTHDTASFAEAVLRLRADMGTYAKGPAETTPPEAIPAYEEVAGIYAAAETLWAYPRAFPRAHALRAVIEGAMEHYAARKRHDGVVDFADQLRLARDVLAESPHLRGEIVRGVGALLVDEFQDTNEVQRDLVYLLRAKENSPGGVPSVDQMETRGLFIVGDPKQSIYSFRNADVGVFRSVTDDLRSRGAESLALQESFRSTGPLVAALNALAGAALAPGTTPNPCEVAFEAEDVLACETPAPQSVAPVLVAHPNPKEGLDEATLVARHIAWAVAEGGLVVRGVGNAPRQARYGDVALLLRGFGRVLDFTRALLEAGIPFTVVKGRGLFDAQEVQDLLALLDVLSGRDAGLGLVTVLRSPMFAVPDVQLQRVHASLPKGQWSALLDVDSGAVSSGATRAFLAALADAPDLRAAAARLGEARVAADRVGLGLAAARVLEDTDYLEVLSLLPNGREAVRNVESVLGEVLSHERRGESGRTVLGGLHRRAEDSREGGSDGGAAASDVVRIMTVHQSKGLQFPVVIAARLGARERTNTPPVHFDRAPTAGLAVRVGRVGERYIDDPHYNRVRAAAALRDLAEEKRIFYVQVTRARDHLLLIGEAGSGRMRDTVLPARASNPELFGEVPAEDLGRASQPKETAPSGEAPRERELLRRVHALPLGRLSLEVSVTELEDHVLCPRRYRAKHVLRLPENPKRELLPGDSAAAPESAGGGASADPRRRGTEVHAVLEHLDFARAAGAAAAELARATRASALAELPPESSARVEALLGSAYAKDLAALPAGAIHRELPFALRLERELGHVTLRGRIDLVVEHGAGIDIVDYKVTSPKDSDSAGDYAFQLACYDRAVRLALPSPGLPPPSRGLPSPSRGGAVASAPASVRAGVWFVDGTPREPAFISAALTEAVSDFDVAVDALLRNARTEATEGKPRPYCDQIRCGYRWLCHPN